MMCAQIVTADQELVPLSRATELRSGKKFQRIFRKSEMRGEGMVVRGLVRTVLREQMATGIEIRVCRREFRESLAEARTEAKEHARKLSEEVALGIDR